MFDFFDFDFLTFLIFLVFSKRSQGFLGPSWRSKRCSRIFSKVFDRRFSSPKTFGPWKRAGSTGSQSSTCAGVAVLPRLAPHPSLMAPRSGSATRSSSLATSISPTALPMGCTTGRRHCRHPSPHGGVSLDIPNEFWRHQNAGWSEA